MKCKVGSREGVEGRRARAGSQQVAGSRARRMQGEEDAGGVGGGGLHSYAHQ